MHTGIQVSLGFSLTKVIVVQVQPHGTVHLNRLGLYERAPFHDRSFFALKSTMRRPSTKRSEL